MNGRETSPYFHNNIHATTVLGVFHNGQMALGADGQATLGNTVAKGNVKKVRRIGDGSILAGFAGSTSDAFTLVEKFEEKLNAFRTNLTRAAVEMAKDWRTDQYLRKMEALLIVMDKETGLVISGDGNVLSPEQDVMAIGSGGEYARSAALALKKHAPHLSAEEIVKEALTIAADICIYTNHNFVIESL
ncbi:MAG: ATP-dependent protease subunit HslV [Bacteroidota bacterium]